MAKILHVTFLKLFKKQIHNLKSFFVFSKRRERFQSIIIFLFRQFVKIKHSKWSQKISLSEHSNLKVNRKGHDSRAMESYGEVEKKIYP